MNCHPEFHFAPTHQQSRKLVGRVFEIHSQTMPGLTRERADAGYLETASKLPLYGISAAKVTQDMMIGVSATGITGIGRRPNGFLGLSLNDRTILFLMILLDETV